MLEIYRENSNIFWFFALYCGCKHFCLSLKIPFGKVTGYLHEDLGEKVGNWPSLSASGSV